MKNLSESNYPMEAVLPKGVTWLKESASGFDPINGIAQTQNSSQISYDVLVLALGMELRYEKVCLKKFAFILGNQKWFACSG